MSFEFPNKFPIKTNKGEDSFSSKGVGRGISHSLAVSTILKGAAGYDLFSAIDVNQKDEDSTLVGGKRIFNFSSFNNV